MLRRLAHRWCVAAAMRASASAIALPLHAMLLTSDAIAQVPKKGTSSTMSCQAGWLRLSPACCSE